MQAHITAHVAPCKLCHPECDGRRTAGLVSLRHGRLFSVTLRPCLVNAIAGAVMMDIRERVGLEGLWGQLADWARAVALLGLFWSLAIW